MKKSLLSIVLALSMLCGAMLSLASCGGQGQPAGEPQSTTYVNLNINPEISFTVDAYGKVVSVVGENEDAQVLLYGEDGIIGVDIEVATEKVVSLAIDMGFISEANKGVETLVTSVNDAVAAALTDKINAKATATAEKAGISLTVSAEGAYTLLRQLEAFKAAHPDDIKISAMSVADFKLALSASENGDITLEAAVALNEAELIRLASSTYSKLEAFHTTAFTKAKLAAEAIYNKVLNLTLDSVYTAYYTKNLTDHLDSFYLGAFYQMYALGAQGFEDLADVVALAEAIGDYELDADTVDTVAASLGLADADKAKLENSDGKITVDSVCAYVDIYMKNLPESADLAAVKADIEAALSAAEAKATEYMQKALEEHLPEIESLRSDMDKLISTLIGISEEEKAELMRAYNEAMEITMTSDFGSEALRAMAAKFAEGMDDILVKINADLSAEEKAEIEEIKAEIEGTLSSYKEQLDAALDSAAETSRNRLQALKDRYLNKSES